MAIKFLNIRSKEVLVAESEPHIAALWGSSDRGPNVAQGQDFGWRLAPEIVVEMRRLIEDEDKLMYIAKRFNKNVDELKEYDILTYISMKHDVNSTPTPNMEDYSDEYYAEIRRLDNAANRHMGTDTPQTATTTTTKSIAQLEAELAARKKAEGGQTSTTTTTKK